MTDRQTDRQTEHTHTHHTHTHTHTHNTHTHTPHTHTHTHTHTGTYDRTDRNVLQSPHSAVNCLQHARSSSYEQPCANHVQHHVQHVCHVVRRDNSAIKFDRVEIALSLALFRWLNHLPMKDEAFCERTIVSLNLLRLKVK